MAPPPRAGAPAGGFGVEAQRVAGPREIHRDAAAHWPRPMAAMVTSCKSISLSLLGLVRI